MGKAIILSGGSRAQDLTAKKENVLAWKTYGGADADLDPGTGIMPDRGAVNASLDCGKSTTIPSGYHNGSGVIRANALSGQTPASASAGQIISGYGGWVNGAKVNGTVVDRGSLQNGSYGASGNYIAINAIPEGWYHGSPRVQIPTASLMSALGITPENIKKGVTIGNVTGTREGYTDSPLLIHNYAPFKSSGATEYKYPWQNYDFWSLHNSANPGEDYVTGSWWTTNNLYNDGFSGWTKSNGTINLTAYKRLEFKIECYYEDPLHNKYLTPSSSSPYHARCHAALMDLSGNVVMSIGPVDNGTYNFDVSGLTGNYYFCVGGTVTVTHSSKNGDKHYYYGECVFISKATLYA
jgi:hypothetical protein